MPSSARGSLGLLAVIVSLTGSLTACGGPSAREHARLAARVDSLGRAVAVLGQKAGLGNNPKEAIRDVRASLGAGLREGDRTSEFVLVEFTDYYCPYCASFAVSALPDIMKQATDLEVVVRNYPIRQIHPKSAAAASAVECIADADTALAWSVHYSLFARQQELGTDGLEAVVGRKLADGSPLHACLSNSDPHPRVVADLREVSRLRLRGTPALILGRRIAGDSVDGMLLPGAYPAAEVLRLLDSLKLGGTQAANSGRKQGLTEGGV